MLEKPVVITNYSTASSQLEDGVDGFIVPLDNEGCAQGIVDAIGNRNRIAEIKENLRKRDFSNRKEIGVLEKLFD